MTKLGLIAIGLVYASIFGWATTLEKRDILWVLDIISTKPTEVIQVSRTCDKKVWKAKHDCRMTIVNKHYESWQQNRKMVTDYCDILASNLYCK